MSAFEVTPLFLQSPQGRIFAIHRIPTASRARHGVIIVPPFAEEMNQARRTLTLLAESLAQTGYHATLFDFFGTGDSDGDFSEASWGGWVEQLACCVNSLHHDHGVETYSLVALRAGALIAVDYLRHALSSPQQLVLWQPVIDGDAYLSQFLRLRLAGDMLSGERDKGAVSSMRQQLAAGEEVEVAGYRLTSALSNGLSSSSLKRLPQAQVPPMCWLELVGSEGQLSPVATRTLVETLKGAGAELFYSTVVGRPFWNSVDIVENRELVAMTVDWIGQGGHAG